MTGNHGIQQLDNDIVVVAATVVVFVVVVVGQDIRPNRALHNSASACQMTGTTSIQYRLVGFVKTVGNLVVHDSAANTYSFCCFSRAVK